MRHLAVVLAILSNLALAQQSASKSQPSDWTVLTDPEIKKSTGVSKTPESYFAQAQALAAKGQKKEALDAYFEAVLQPSNKDLEYTSALEEFYLKEHFGSRRQFAAALEAKRAERFKASGYKPELVYRAAPQVEFVTLAGETFNPEKLAGKTMVVNFWSPG
jgi:hypothetical protein